LQNFHTKITVAPLRSLQEPHQMLAGNA